MTTQRRNNRMADLAKIHIARKQLSMSEDAYRAMLQSVAGVASAGDLDLRGRGKVLQHLKNLGWKPKTRKKKQVVTPSLPQDKKIRALWLDMHNEGVVKHPEEAALRSYVRRITGCDRLEWITTKQASIVIESLKQWQMRSRNGNEQR